MHALIDSHEQRLQRRYPEDLLEQGVCDGYKMPRDPFHGACLLEEVMEDGIERRDSSETVENFCNLLDKMFTFNPQKRITAAEALDEPFCRTVQNSHVQELV